MWAVMAVKKWIGVELPVLHIKQEVPLNCADGMVGMMPVFKTKRDAQRYAGKEFDVAKVIVREGI